MNVIVIFISDGLLFSRLTRERQTESGLAGNGIFINFPEINISSSKYFHAVEFVELPYKWLVTTRIIYESTVHLNILVDFESGIKPNAHQF